MAFDYKKAYREFYLPPAAPQIVDVPAMPFLEVEGKGDPNGEDGAYKTAVRQLYTIAYTIKMSKLDGRAPEGYFDYVVPPLEGLWWTEEGAVDFARKERFHWLALIRLPEFATPEVVSRAVEEAERKKRMNCSAVKWFSYTDGMCVQCMHIGPYDSEPATIAAMETYAREQGYETDLGGDRRHHEIYLGDPRRCAPEKLKTVIRQPVRRPG